MITKVYTGRVGRYYPETRYYNPGTDVRAVAAVPFRSYDFASEDDVPGDGDWADPDSAYIPDPLPESVPEVSLMEERQAWKDQLAADAAAAEQARLAQEAQAVAAASEQPAPGPLLPDPPAADPPARGVRSRQAGAAEPDPDVPAAAGQEG